MGQEYDKNILFIGILLIVLVFIVFRCMGCAAIKDPGKLYFQATVYPQIGLAYLISRIGTEPEPKLSIHDRWQRPIDNDERN